MAAEVLKCPMCGASATSESTRCEHCGARLATIACPSCFGMMFMGQKFCPHCGARADRVDADEAAKYKCPRCRLGLKEVQLGQMQLFECETCEGLWADKVSLEQICADRERQAAVLGMPGDINRDESVQLEQVRYVPCPVCQKLMNRVNFARCSHVIVDVCREHGTWFDKDELRRIVEFIRSGGMDLARQKELDEIEERRRALSAQAAANAWTGPEDLKQHSSPSLLSMLLGL